MHSTEVTCPSCYEVFAVPAPSIDELPADVDYDCEICCRPLRIYFEEDEDEIIATAYGLGDNGPCG